MVLAAMYLLIMVGKVVFGKLKEPESNGDHSSLPSDLCPREIGILVPLAALCIWIGVQPTVLTDAMRGSVEGVLSPYPKIVQKEQGTPAAPILIEKEENHG
jgi:NADH-quinone oxidoreductase subunit M